MDKHTPPTNIKEKGRKIPTRRRTIFKGKIDIMLQEYKEIKGSLNTIIK
jgi:hypothetical protein